MLWPWNGRDPHDVGALRHEPVHVVQYGGRRGAGSQRAELAARRPRAARPRERGREPRFERLEIQVRSRCAPRAAHR